jgi:hydroxymethylglutaryl-CoA lyase
MHIPSTVVIKEVGPRDGLQNEKVILSTKDKITWINQLANTGLSYIEVTSFVPAKWIPALADALEVATGIERKQGITYAALVPNIYGLERAIQANIDEVNVFVSSSETHNKRNVNKSIDETIQVIKEVTKQSLFEGKKVRGYVSTIFGCPYEGKIELDKIKRMIDSLLEMGIYEISLGDTIGIANPLQVEQALDELLSSFPASVFAMHFHNTYGRALANILVSLQKGITTYDSSFGGLGGCPYAAGASGNVATNDLVNMLHAMDIQTGIDEKALTMARKIIDDKFGKRFSSHLLQVQKEQLKK